MVMAHTILVSGASGMVGRPLVDHLSSAGHTVRTLVRREPESDVEISWSPSEGRLDPAAVDGVDAVINLNGASIAGRRWTASYRQLLWSSRIDSTTTLVRAIAAADNPPPVLVSVSATGFYGDRGDEKLDEESRRGSGFLADLSEAWEAAARDAESDRTRVVCPRLGMVLGDGGALDKMLPIFKLGLGGPLGSGRQFWPWVHVGDVIAALAFLVENPIHGPVNVVAPEEVRCAEFSATLGRVLHRPAFLPAPGFAVKAAMGQMADELLLSSARVRPDRLSSEGFAFGHPSLQSALEDLL